MNDLFIGPGGRMLVAGIAESSPSRFSRRVSIAFITGASLAAWLTTLAAVQAVLP